MIQPVFVMLLVPVSLKIIINETRQHCDNG